MRPGAGPYLSGNALSVGRASVDAPAARMVEHLGTDPCVVAVLSWPDGAEARALFEGPYARGDALAYLARLGWRPAAADHAAETAAAGPGGRASACDPAECVSVDTIKGGLQAAPPRG